jgi:hypothetical protein
MLGNQAPDDFHVLGAQPTPLHPLGNKHSQLLADPIFGNQPKISSDLIFAKTALNRYPLSEAIAFNVYPGLKHHKR